MFNELPIRDAITWTTVAGYAQQGHSEEAITGFIKRSHRSLAAIGVAAFVRMINTAGPLFSDKFCKARASGLLTAFTEHTKIIDSSKTT